MIRLIPLEDLLKIIALHFLALKDMELALAQSIAISKSFCRFSGLSDIKTISSAKPSAAILILPKRARNSEELSLSRRSFIKILNKLGLAYYLEELPY